MAESVYITGIAGFVGSTLAKSLRAEGYSVTGCDNLSLSDGSNLEGVDVCWEVADFADVENIEADTIVHLAALTNARSSDKDSMIQENYMHTTLLRARNPNKRFIFASTCLVAMPHLNAYARSKYLAESYLTAFGEDYVILRFGNVYGPNQRDWGEEPNVLAAWKKARAEGENLRIDGDGNQTRDFIHVSDVCDGIRQSIANKYVKAETIALCTGKQHSINELRELVYPQAAFEYAPRNPLDYDHIEQSPDKAKCLLGFTAKRDVENYKPTGEDADE
jgi:UDP-glucose 4-epimerase